VRKFNEMDAVSSKSKPRKSMRVATVFTGVAAATVGMAQAAGAQDVANAAHKPASGHIARQVRPASQYKYGSIRSVFECGYPGTDPNWLHVDWYNNSLQTGESICYGYKGFMVSPPTVGISAECGGNNHGSLLGYSDNATKEWVYDFGPGTTYRHLNKGSLYQVAIWSWTGNDKCGRI
jgi:hypothetical protein